MLIDDQSVELISELLQSSSCYHRSSSLLDKFKFNFIFFPKRFSKLFQLFIFFIVTSSKIFIINGEKFCPGFIIRELGGITCEIRKDILDAHNEMRQAIAGGFVKNQPSASNMRKMYWDDELAEGAQKWANHCTFEHNDIADRDTARFQVGQNIAITKNKGRVPKIKEFRKQVKNWFDEYKLYTFGTVNENLKSTGHYTQLVWAETYLVGCGFSRFEDAVYNVSYRLYVCHYGPSGNVLDEEPYKRGNIKCPNGTIQSQKYNALCALKSPPLDNCDKSLEYRKGENARRFNWLNKYDPLGINRRVLYNRNLSAVQFYDSNINPFGPKDITAFIIFKFIIKLT